MLVILHPALNPPADADGANEFAPWICEYDVIQALRKLGHQVEIQPVDDDLKSLREKIEKFSPHLIFNLLEQFAGETSFDQNIVSYLEMLRIPYTGCNPRGLMIARNKSLAKKILRYHRILTPEFHSFPYNRKFKLPRILSFPLLVKCMREEASLGISKASVVNNADKLKERVTYLFDQFQADVMAEKFIAGRELTCGVIGNHRLQTLPVCELCYENVDDPAKEFYTERTKWSQKLREKKGVQVRKAKLSAALEQKLADISKRIYRNLELDGVARMDFRMTQDEEIYFIEANPNPNLARLDELAIAGKYADISYYQLIQKIVSLGLQRGRA